MATVALRGSFRRFAFIYRTGYDFKRLFTISEYYDRNREAFYSALQQGRLTIADFEALCPEVSRRSLQRDLAVLEEKGLLHHEGETNNLFYILDLRNNPCPKKTCDKLTT